MKNKRLFKEVNIEWIPMNSTDIICTSNEDVPRMEDDEFNFSNT